MRWSVLALATVVFLQPAQELLAQQSPAKRVLLVSTGTRLAPGYVLADQQIRRALDEIPGGVEMSAENLDINYLSRENSQRVFLDYLKSKYGQDPSPDLVILVYAGSLAPAAHVLVQLFPHTPILVAGYTEEEIRPDEFGPTVSGIVQRLDAKATAELMLFLQPDLQRIVVVGGTADVDQQLMQRIKIELKPLADTVGIDYWDTLTLSELRSKVSTLPPATAVLYARMYRDAAGQSVISAEVAQMIGRLANRPVYVLTDAGLGTGVVGGAIGSAEAFARVTGETARAMLTGAAPSPRGIEIQTDTVPIFDWRALQRWNISEARLPPGSVLRYKPQSMWDQYRGYILGALILLALQTSLIVALFSERRARNRMKQAAEESQELAELAASTGEVGLWLRDIDSGSLWMNAGARGIFGLGENEPLQFEDVLARIHPADISHVRMETQKAQATGVPFEMEYRVPQPDGTDRWILVKGRVLNGQHGQSHRIGIVVDITQRKAMEMELHQKRLELAHIMRVTILGELTASLAHELRQPLTAILSNVQAAQRFLKQEPCNMAEVRESLEDTVTAHQRAAQVIDHIYSLIKREEHDFTAVQLRELVPGVLILLRSSMIVQGVHVVSELDPELPSIRGDAVQLEQVLINLLLNAFEAMKDTPAAQRTVTLRAQSDDGMVRVAVIDSGSGIPPEHLNRVFEPFYSGKTQGLGMGLAICRSIIARHGGKLWAENNRERGATFYLTLPVHVMAMSAA